MADFTPEAKAFADRIVLAFTRKRAQATTLAEKTAANQWLARRIAEVKTAADQKETIECLELNDTN